MGNSVWRILRGDEQGRPTLVVGLVHPRGPRLWAVELGSRAPVPAVVVIVRGGVAARRLEDVQELAAAIRAVAADLQRSAGPPANIFIATYTPLYRILRLR